VSPRKPPRKPSLLLQLGWRVECLAFDAYSAVNRLLPVEWMSAFGGWVLKTLGPLTGTHRIAERNLRIAFPDMPPPERERLLKLQWESLGRYFGEFPQVDRLTPAAGRVEVVGGERLEAIAKSGQPVVLISGHFANFEVMAAVIMHYGVNCNVTYRAANNPYIDKRIIEARESYGVKLFAPKGGDGSREILEGFKHGWSVSFLNDQKFNQGIPVPLFGAPAHTAHAPTRLAMKVGTYLQPMSVQRLPGARFRVTLHEPIVPEKTGDKSADIEAGVRRVNAFIEARVREHPEDWWWVHKRWPNAAYKALEER
jgi:Kdo2-lipid IVA lauroyltransferase/acyltransferase